MNFEKRERMLDAISSEISNSENNINKLINKQEQNNAFIGKVNHKLRKYQKEKMNQKIAQIHHLNMLYDYLEKKMNKKNERTILFQQNQLVKLRAKIEKDIKKYM
tara:strand:- start:35 stop:349 length:315 start_codon:yes stop_codon:yes gene_type:complete